MICLASSGLFKNTYIYAGSDGLLSVIAATKLTSSQSMSRTFRFEDLSQLTCEYSYLYQPVPYHRSMHTITHLHRYVIDQSYTLCLPRVLCGISKETIFCWRPQYNTPSTCKSATHKNTFKCKDVLIIIQYMYVHAPPTFQ